MGLKESIQQTFFYSKILLFGEYGVIDDAMALSIPYQDYKARFEFVDELTDKNHIESHKHLRDYVEFLETLNTENALFCKLDFPRMKTDLANNMVFESTIPTGYGVGSSGALVAAIYNRYALDKPSDKSDDYFFELKRIFAQLESHFHGKSSGLDPLICYVNLPMLLKSKTDLQTTDLPNVEKGKGVVFLLNSQKQRQAHSLIEYFLTQCKEEGFRNMLKKQFKRYNDACVKDFLNADFSSLLQNVKELSKIVFCHFKPMIPERFHGIWQDGIDSNLYYLKLCGAGGGGFIMGFTHDFEKTKEKLSPYQLSIVHRF